jgi:gliding motility-associated-like protein
MKRILLLLFFAGLTHFLSAQVAAPNLICVSNDTLIWETPVNTCGPFNAYEIYASQNLNGPYQLLETITNPGQTSYYHAFVTGMTWFYYLKSTFNCPGQIALSSDTLDNRIPEPGPLQLVTVSGNNVEVTWNPSPSPETVMYVVSRNTTSGTTVLDTIFNGNTLFFIDQTADPNAGIETYFVVALDACGNKSLVTQPHNTIFLTATPGNGCDARISLSWNAYQNWPGGVSAYEIWVGINGAAPVLAAEAPGNATAFNYEGVNDQDTYCFFVRARQTGAATASNSNVACQTPNVVQAVRNLLLENASYTPDGTIEWQWRWNTTAAIESAAVQRATTPGGNFDDTGVFPVPTVLTETNTLLSADMPAMPEYYRVRTVDSCDRTTLSNVVRPPGITGIGGEDGMNNLTWTAYVNDSATVLSYEVYRLSVSGETLLVTVSGTVLLYSDAVDFSGPESGRQCYFVVAVAELRLPDGTTKTVRSRSNTTCVEQIPKIFIPNVFAPEGINRTFEPFLQFGTVEEYQMTIYDRWGGQVFVSNDVTLGWNGEKDGRPMPQGIYIYFIRLKQLSGTAIERTGSVMLLR